MQGYLHKNVQGQWYPVCSITSSWAIDACLSEIGQPLTYVINYIIYSIYTSDILYLKLRWKKYADNNLI